jgi:hypothetical protein
VTTAETPEYRVAHYKNPDITYTIWNLDDRNDTLTRSHDLRWVNWSGSEPYLAHEFFSTFSNQGRWRVSWTLTWQSCDEDAFENHPFSANMIHNMST